MKSKGLSLQGPSITRIIWTDYTAFLATIFPVVIWIVYLAWVPDWRGDGPVIPAWMVSYVLVFSLLVTLGGALILAWRVWLINSAFRNGSVVSGRIAAVSLKRDRGRLEYTYTFKKKFYQSGVAIHRNAQTKELRAGEKIILLVDPKQPTRAFMRDLYI
jgi:hypothetical protein